MADNKMGVPEIRVYQGMDIFFIADPGVYVLCVPPACFDKR